MSGKRFGIGPEPFWLSSLSSSNSGILLTMLTSDISLCTCGTFYELGRSQMQFKTLIESPSSQENKFVTFLLELSVEVDFCPLMVEQGCRVSTENRGDHLVSQPASLFL